MLNCTKTISLRDYGLPKEARKKIREKKRKKIKSTKNDGNNNILFWNAGLEQIPVDMQRVQLGQEDSKAG